MTGLARWADEHDSWVTFKKAGFNFVYAALPYSVAKSAADVCGPGFAHCFYDDQGGFARGQWRLFVVNDMVPPEFVDFVAIHERGEQLSLGNHFWASKLEFAYVRHQGKVRSYSGWIDDKHPRKFNDLMQETLFPILPDDLLETLKLETPQDVGECQHGEALINKHPIPTLVLRYIDRYEQATQTALDSINDLIGPTQSVIKDIYRESSMLPTHEISKGVAGIMDKNIRGALLSLDRKTMKGLCRARMNLQLQAYFAFVCEGVHSNYRSDIHVDMEQDFDIAYKNAVSGKNVVSQFLTAEEEKSLNKIDDIHSYVIGA